MKFKLHPPESENYFSFYVPAFSRCSRGTSIYDERSYISYFIPPPPPSFIPPPPAALQAREEACLQRRGDESPPALGPIKPRLVACVVLPCVIGPRATPQLPRLTFLSVLMLCVLSQQCPLRSPISATPRGPPLVLRFSSLCTHDS